MATPPRAATKATKARALAAAIMVLVFGGWVNQYFGWREAAGLVGVLLFQALPLPLLGIGLVLGAPLWFLLICSGLLALRVGVLFGVARAYPKRPWSYWLSPLCDLPVTLRIIQFALRRRHSWRGRNYVRRKGGVFEPLP